METCKHGSGQALGNLPQKCGKAPSAEPTIYKDGKYCTFPHTIEFLNKPYADIFTILTSYPSLENYLSPFMDAWKGGAQDQLQGQIASAKIPLSRMISPQLYWVMTGDDFTLDLNNPNEPKILCVGNNPDRQNIYSAALGLYNSRIVKLVNKKGQLKSSIIIDELPTIYFRGIDNLIATARSNKVAVCLGFQDYSQLARDYGDKEAKVIQNTVGNIFSGQVVGETAKNLSERFGKILQQRQSVSINRQDTSTSINTQLDFLIPASKISNLSQGTLVVAWRITSARRLTRRFSTHASSWIVQRSMPRQRHTRRFLSSMSSKTRTATTLCRSR